MNDILNSIELLFKEERYYIRLNLIPHITKNFNKILKDEDLIKILLELETKGYEIGFIDGDDRLCFNKPIESIKEDVLEEVYSGDLIIYNK